MSLKPKEETGTNLLPPKESNEYPNLANLELVKQELQKLLISKGIRDDVSKVLDDQNLKNEFQTFLAGQLSPEFKKSLQELTSDVKTYNENTSAGIRYAAIAAVNLFTYLMSAHDKKYEFADFLAILFGCLFLVSGSVSLYQFHKNNKFTGNEIRAIRKNSEPMKDRRLMLQLYDYLFCIYQVKQIGEKYFVSGKKEIKQLGQEMIQAADKHKEKVEEFMAMMEDVFKKSGKSANSGEDMDHKIKAQVSTTELLALLKKAQRFSTEPILTEEQLKKLN